MTDQYRPLKDAFGRFATGIGVAACRKEDGSYAALTVNSFTSVSLGPPLVLWCIERRASSFPAFMAADSYAVSILRADQQHLSERFASHQPAPLSAEEIDIWRSGAPLLKNRLAGFDCEVEERHRAGDHIILVGKVLQFDSADGAPLIYFSSSYCKGVGGS